MKPIHNLEKDQNAEVASPEHFSPAAQTISKEEHNRLFQRGLKWLGVGVALMGLSFSFNFFFSHSDTPVVTIMYLLTSLGTACILKCLADILGF